MFHDALVPFVERRVIKMEKLILIGAGGYAKSVIDSVDYYNYELVGFIDEFTQSKTHLGLSLIHI